MAGLTDAEGKRLKAVVARRLGARSDAAELVRAYLDAMARNAYFRTTDGSPVPTSLTAERSLLLIEISRQLERVIEDFEIQALLRVPMASARSMRTTLLATYTDDVDRLTQAWALRGARTGKRLTTDGGWSGASITLVSEDRRDVFVDLLERVGIPVELVLDDDKHPWQVVVGDAFPKADLPG